MVLSALRHIEYDEAGRIWRKLVESGVSIKLSCQGFRLIFRYRWMHRYLQTQGKGLERFANANHDENGNDYA